MTIVFDYVTNNGRCKQRFFYHDYYSFLQSVECGEIAKEKVVHIDKAWINGTIVPAYTLFDLMLLARSTMYVAPSDLIIYFDMDGTLVVWDYSAHIDTVMSPGYFSSLQPITNMVEAVQHLMSMGCHVRILSKVILGTTAVEDKNAWLNRHLPDIADDDRHFVPYTATKSSGINPMLPFSVLVDDSTHFGLEGWTGVGIKVDNGINNSRRSWDGYTVSTQSKPLIIANTISAIASHEYSDIVRTIADRVIEEMRSTL